MAGGTLYSGNATYGNGTSTASSGANTIVHYYDRAGIKAANEINVYQQFADRKSMPQKHGKTFKISKWTHIYDLAEDDANFAANGYLGKRDISTISAVLAATDGSGAGLAEGAGAVNKVVPKKVTVTTDLARYGYMVPYTDEVELFSEDPVQVRYREELGRLMNITNEDLLQVDMLATTNVINAAEVDFDQLGVTITGAGANEAAYKVSFDLIRKGVRSLVRNRAMRNTTIVNGSTKVDTRTVNKAFYAIVGPEIKYDLETLTRGSTYATEFAYIPAFKYAAAGNLAEGEIGQMHDVRFIESEAAMNESGAGAYVSTADGGVVLDYVGDLSYTDNVGATDDLTVDAVFAARGRIALKNVTGTNGTVNTITDTYTTAASAKAVTGYGTDWIPIGEYYDVFPILFPTKGSFASVGLKGKGKIKFNSKSPEAVELSNPYGTQGFFSANMWYAGLILQSEKLLRINTLATA